MTEERYAGVVGVNDHILNWNCVMDEDDLVRIDRFTVVPNVTPLLVHIDGTAKNNNKFHRYVLQADAVAHMIVDGTENQIGLWKRRGEANIDRCYFEVSPSLLIENLRFGEGLMEQWTAKARHFAMVSTYYDCVLHMICRKQPLVERALPMGRL